MWHRPRSLFLALALVLAAAAALACGGSSTTSTPGNGNTGGAAGSVNGVAVDIATGVRLSGVAVSGGGKSTTTDASGAFTLSGLSTGTVVLTLSKTGYAPAYATPTVGSSAAPALVSLKQEGAAQAYNPSTTATLSTTTDAGPYAVIFTPGTLDTTDTNLTVSVTPLDPTRERDALPGALQTSGSSGTMLLPVTFAEFTIRDSGGNKVQLKSGSNATVELPIPLSLRPTYPLGTHIHCYAFNPTSGDWEDFVDGTVATSSVDGVTPVLTASIRHFSWYGGAPEGNSCKDLWGQVVSAVDGKPLGNARVEASPGTATYTDANGNFQLLVPADQATTITAYQTGIDVSGSLTGIAGAKYIEFGKLADVTVTSGTAKSCTVVAPSPVPNGFTPVVVSIGTIAQAQYEVTGYFTGATSGEPNGSAILTIQTGLPGPDGELQDPVAASGAVVKLIGPNGSVTLPEISPGTGLYALSDMTFVIQPGKTYQVTVDVDGNGSVDGTGTIPIVGELAWTSPAESASVSSSGLTLTWSDTGSSDPTYAPLYVVSVSQDGGSAFDSYFGSARTFSPHDLTQSATTPLPTGDYTASLTAFGGFAQGAGGSIFQPTRNFTGVGIGGWLASFASPPDDRHFHVQ